MNQIDQNGYDLNMEEEAEEDQLEEEEDDRLEDQENENEDQEQENPEDEMEVESEEEADNIFQTMAYGINPENKSKIEKKLIQPKDWYLRGEVQANQRPKEQLID